MSVPLGEAPLDSLESGVPDAADDEPVAQGAGGESPEAQEDGYVDVDYEGDTYSVPVSLKDALLRQADYTQKTMSLADERRAVESERAALQERAQVIGLQQAASQEIAQDQALILALNARAEELDGLDWSKLIQDSPQQALVLQQQRQAIESARQSSYQRMQAAQAQFEASHNAAMQQAAMAGEAQLRKDIDGWGSNEYRDNLAHYGVSMGFTPAEMRLVYQPVDPRYLRVLHKAYLYDQSKKSGGSVKQAVKPIKVLSGSGVDVEKSLSGQMSDSEWIANRERQLKRANRRA